MAKKLICFPFETNKDGTESLCECVGVELSDDERQLCYKQGIFITEEYGDTILWYPQRTLYLTLTYDGCGRGRSAVTFYWKDQDGNRYPMFLTDMDNMIKKNKARLKIKEEFDFVKRGANYGIKLCEVNNDKS
ncbi:MAG: hypothetical protein RSF40_01330 [Oscillospiraceae bacterium]